MTLRRFLGGWLFKLVLYWSCWQCAPCNANPLDDLHWSLRPVRDVDLPKVADRDWASNPIDRFILFHLEKNGLDPSVPTDRYTLMRRVFLDIQGLPPRLHDVDAFVQDTRPDAYVRLVDVVLASPHFGERWGRHWLDQARYADSHGYTIDKKRSMWPYRDWVIRAFNQDMLFDQFSVEQLAGDLLPNASLDQRVATGFHRNTLVNMEGGVKADQFRVEQVKDRVDTTGLVWMGLTVGCANCHDHKYDPIEQAEYYRLYAFFNSTEDENSVAPIEQIPSANQEQRRAELQRELEKIKKDIESPHEQRDARRAKWERELVADVGVVRWELLEGESESLKGAQFTRPGDGSFLVQGVNAANDRYTVETVAPLDEIYSLRLEALTHESLVKTGPGRARNGNFVLSEIQVRTTDGVLHPFASAFADHSQKDFEVSGAIDSNSKTGWAVNGSPEGGPNHGRVAVFNFTHPVSVVDGTRLVVTLAFDHGKAEYNLGRFRLSVASSLATSADPMETERARIAAMPIEKRLAKDQQKLTLAFQQSDPELSQLNAQREQLKKDLDQVEKGIPTTMVMRELDKPRETAIQVRGDFLRPGQVVLPDVLGKLPALPSSNAPRTRLDLARWLVNGDHPLTARVRMNRVWGYLFGHGIVETENDFGTQGSGPSHPELLEWLAGEFPRQQWSTKRMLRNILLSSSYQQSSKGRSDLQQLDPRNKLIARQSRLRVEAEVVRDLALAASGLLSHKIGGPGVYPPQPEGVYSFTQAETTWKTSPGEDRYRRGMYTFFYRSAPHPLLSVFDVPKFNQTCTQRSRSNTPLQALTVANDEALYEASQVLAARVLREVNETEGIEARLVRAFRLCLCRLPEENELARIHAYFNEEERRFRSSPNDVQAVFSLGPDASPENPEAAAWISVARLLVNLDEFITRE